MADVLAPTHACTTANTSVNYSGCVPQRYLKTSHCPNGKLTFSHRPHGRLTFARCLQGGGVIVTGGTVTLSSCTISGNTASSVRAHVQNFPMAPMGRLLTSLPRLTLAQLRPMLWSTTVGSCRRDLKFPIAPTGNSHFARCLQGGGVYVGGGTVTISSCTISGNTAYYVRAHPQKFPMPPWETHVLLVVCRVAVSMSGVAQ